MVDGGVESIRLVELEEPLGRRPSGRQWRRLGGKIEIGENGSNGNGIGDEGDDTHGSAANTHDGQDDGRTS